MLDSDVAPSGGYYKRPFGIETEEERSLRRNRIQGYFGAYSEIDGPAHQGREALQEIATNLAQSERISHRFAAASALAEINMHFPGEDWSENQRVASELLVGILEQQEPSIKRFDVERMLICLPLFAIPAAIETMSPDELREGFRETQHELLRLMQRMQNYSRRKDLTIRDRSWLVGKSNEVTILAGLLSSRMADLGLVPVPALYWQDTGTMSQAEGVEDKTANRRVDITFAGLLGRNTPKPLQVKSSDGKSHQAHYHPDVKVVDAKLIKKSVLKNLEGASKLRDFAALYQLFVNAQPSAITSRVRVLEDVLLGEITLGSIEK